MKLLNLNFLAKCPVHKDIVQNDSVTSKLFQADEAQSVSDAYKSFQTMKTTQEILADEAGECEEYLWREGDSAESRVGAFNWVNNNGNSCSHIQFREQLWT